MKKILIILSISLATAVISSSCERCHTCTYDGANLDNDTITEICSTNRNILQDQVRVLENTNWSCDD